MTATDHTHLARAEALLQAGELGKAEELCRGMLETIADRPEPRVLLGRILQAAGKPELAQAEYRTAVKMNPTYVEAWRAWSALLTAYGHSKTAAVCLREALTYAPKSSELHNDLGLVELALGNANQGAIHLERALELAPSAISALNNLGLARRAQGRYEDAMACYRRALEISPDVAELHNNLGDLLKGSDADAAIAALTTALRLRPDYPEALDNLGVAYFCKNRLEDALEKFEHAARLQPQFGQATAHKATLLFLLGRLPEAWTLHRHRYALAGIKGAPYKRIPLPVWSGESLAGKSLLIWTELGLGEEVLQASMFNDARAVASRLIVECSPRVLTLFQRSFPDVSFVPRVDPSRAPEGPIMADYQVAGGDLGGSFRPDFRAFPQHQGYLKADSDKAAQLRQKYRADAIAPAAQKSAHTRATLVGISWASHNAALGGAKTLALVDLAPILRTPGVKFVNLQYRAQPEEVAAAETALNIHIETDATINLLGDIDDVAAQIAALDLVISVSNSAVHLAGALNVPVWNIVPGYNGSAMWHWFHDRDTSPWYPSMRIYRRREQSAATVIEKIAVDLRHFLEKSKD